MIVSIDNSWATLGNVQQAVKQMDRNIAIFKKEEHPVCFNIIQSNIEIT